MQVRLIPVVHCPEAAHLIVIHLDRYCRSIHSSFAWAASTRVIDKIENDEPFFRHRHIEKKKTRKIYFSTSWRGSHSESVQIENPFVWYGSPREVELSAEPFFPFSLLLSQNAEYATKKKNYWKSVFITTLKHWNASIRECNEPRAMTSASASAFVRPLNGALMQNILFSA